MSYSATIVTIITVAAALVLAVRGLRSHQPSGRRTVMMAAAWVVIIASVALLVDGLAS